MTKANRPAEIDFRRKNVLRETIRVTEWQQVNVSQEIAKLQKQLAALEDERLNLLDEFDSLPEYDDA